MKSPISDSSLSEIEITPEMIEAGSAALETFDPRDDSRAGYVALVYEAMEIARRKTSPRPATRG
jgi:hypothetical protein